MTGVIDAYVDELGNALRGPRYARTDLLTEARDSLLDATAAYEHAGLDRSSAERRAVADFGEVEEIAPAYRTELGLTQSRRTAWLMLLVIGAQPFLWQGWWPWFSEYPDYAPGMAYNAVNQTVEWLGATVVITSLLCVVVLGAGTRYVEVHRRLIRAIGLGALALCAVLAMLGLLMSALSPDGTFLAGLLWLVPLLLLPLATVAAAARKCLAVA